MNYCDHIWRPWRVRGNGTTIASKREWRKPKRWNELAALSATPTFRVLLDVDIWDIGARAMPDASRTIWRTIDATPNLTWLVFTRYAGIAQVIRERRLNLWLGVDVSTQQEADELIPALLQCRDLCGKLIVRVTVTERIDLDEHLMMANCFGDPEIPGGLCHFASPRRDGGLPMPDWLILQGDVGRFARPCNVAHVRELVRQASEAGVPCWVERLGSRCDFGDGEPASWMTSRILDSHGVDPTEWPEDLRVREVPT